MPITSALTAVKSHPSYNCCKEICECVLTVMLRLVRTHDLVKLPTRRMAVWLVHARVFHAYLCECVHLRLDCLHVRQYWHVRKSFSINNITESIVLIDKPYRSFNFQSSISK